MAHTVSLEIAKQLKEAGYPQSGEGWFQNIEPHRKSKRITPNPPAFFEIFITDDCFQMQEHYIKLPTLGELIRHPLLKNYVYCWDEIEGELLFWAEPPNSDCIEDLYSESTPEDALGLALIDELKKAKQEVE